MLDDADDSGRGFHDSVVPTHQHGMFSVITGSGFEDPKGADSGGQIFKAREVVDERRQG